MFLSRADYVLKPLHVGVVRPNPTQVINAQPLEKVKLATLADSYSSAQS